MWPIRQTDFVGKKQSSTTCFWICPLEGEKQPQSVRLTWQSSDILSKLRDREKTILAAIEQTAERSSKLSGVLRCSRLGSTTGQESTPRREKRSQKLGLRKKLRLRVPCQVSLLPYSTDSYFQDFVFLFEFVFVFAFVMTNIKVTNMKNTIWQCQLLTLFNIYLRSTKSVCICDGTMLCLLILRIKAGSRNLKEQVFASQKGSRIKEYMSASQKGTMWHLFNWCYTVPHC